MEAERSGEIRYVVSVYNGREYAKIHEDEGKVTARGYTREGLPFNTIPPPAAVSQSTRLKRGFRAESCK